MISAAASTAVSTRASTAARLPLVAIQHHTLTTNQPQIVDNLNDENDENAGVVVNSNNSRRNRRSSRKPDTPKQHQLQQELMPPPAPVLPKDGDGGGKHLSLRLKFFKSI